MNTIKLLAMVAAAPFIFLHPAYAEPAANPAVGEKLQKEAEQILATDPAAKKVTIREEVKPINYNAKDAIQISDLDLNRDGVFDRDEVGERLFRIFDGDGNMVIDNIEMKIPRVAAFIPMERKTIDIIEYDNAGLQVKTTITQDEFLERSLLSRFDKDLDGLTPEDFLGQSFTRVNVRKDNVLDLYEWKRAYAAVVKPRHMEDFNYND